MLRMGTAHPLVTGSILQSWETRHWLMSTHISSLVPLSSPSLAPASSLPCRRTLTKCEFSIINSTQEAGQILHRCSPQGKSGDLHKIAAPDPESYFNHRDHRHCFKGSLVGGMFLIASFISLGIYVTWTLQGVKEVFASMHFLLCFLLNLFLPFQYDTSYLYKITSLLMTCTGIITAVIGLVQIQASTPPPQVLLPSELSSSCEN